MVEYAGFGSVVWAVLSSFFWRGGLCAHHQPWADRYGPGWREFGRVRASGPGSLALQVFKYDWFRGAGEGASGRSARDSFRERAMQLLRFWTWSRNIRFPLTNIGLYGILAFPARRQSELLVIRRTVRPDFSLPKT
ncbi:uncharacterized protein IWZ02DRAFT_102086 [Phyllosticta citriasiana]|uniref:uncharacterized protein n=1 Tax=Phyllosticta citriasiana TaxID=595635 RepID=UPI0030FDCC80